MGGGSLTWSITLDDCYTVSRSPVRGVSESPDQVEHRRANERILRTLTTPGRVEGVNEKPVELWTDEPLGSSISFPVESLSLLEAVRVSSSRPLLLLIHDRLYFLPGKVALFQEPLGHSRDRPPVRLYQALGLS